jgi:hypothetical protein
MTDNQRPGDQPPPNADPRRTTNPPKPPSKDTGKAEETPTSSPDAAIPPDEMNAQNDK